MAICISGISLLKKRLLLLLTGKQRGSILHTGNMLLLSLFSIGLTIGQRSLRGSWILGRWKVLCYDFCIRILNFERKNCAPQDTLHSEINQPLRNHFESLSQIDKTILTHITESKPLSYWKVPHIVSNTCCVSRCKISKLGPVPTSVQLVIACGKIPGCVEGSAIGIALNVLLSISMISSL